MTNKFSLLSALVICGSFGAFAQIASAAEPTSKTVATDAQGKTLVGAPLGYNPAAGNPDEGDGDTVYVLSDGTVKQTGAWSEADRQACKASGGIEIPLPAGRIGCIRL